MRQLKIMQTTSKRHLILLYDNTLDGLLSAIFDVYRLKLEDFTIVSNKNYHEILFKPTLKVVTNKAKANRIKIGIKRRTKENILPYLAHFFETTTQKEQAIYQFIHYIFQQKTIVSKLHYTTNT